jgi:3-oxoacyl-[acyl-carrier protein] reductase
MKANIGSAEEVQAMMAKIVETVGPVDVLVNNAGITKDMLVMMMKPTDFTDVIRYLIVCYHDRCFIPH